MIQHHVVSFYVSYIFGTAAIETYCLCIYVQNIKVCNSLHNCDIFITLQFGYPHNQYIQQFLTASSETHNLLKLITISRVHLQEINSKLVYYQIRKIYFDNKTNLRIFSRKTPIWTLLQFFSPSISFCKTLQNSKNVYNFYCSMKHLYLHEKTVLHIRHPETNKTKRLYPREISYSRFGLLEGFSHAGYLSTQVYQRHFALVCYPQLHLRTFERM